MKTVLYLLFTLLFSVSGFSQAQNDGWVIRKTLGIPKINSTSTEEIADFINENFTTEYDKVLAAYTWVTANLKYSTDSANHINLGPDAQAKITAAFRRRKGVCENFAYIFTDIVTHCGLTAFVVDGYTKQNGFIDKSGHSWCIVFVNKEWQLFDPTWDEGRYINPVFFMMPPQEFIATHIPYDPIWQLLSHPVTHLQFKSGNFYAEKNVFFNYKDSLMAYVKMDSLHRYQSTALRMQQDEINSELVKNNYNLIKMNIEMINQDKDVDLYNSSVVEINEASAILNNFIQYRNNKFTPEKSDAELQNMLGGMDSKLEEAMKKLYEIDRSPATFTIGTDKVKEKIKSLTDKANEQKDFIKRYTATEKTNRISLFYK